MAAEVAVPPPTAGPSTSTSTSGRAAGTSAAACAPSAERLAYAAEMRRLFSPAGMVDEAGAIRQDYFKPKRVVLINDRKWGEAERDALYRGLELHGVGRWREIGAELLPGWDDQGIRVRASRLLGSQSLVRWGRERCLGASLCGVRGARVGEGGPGARTGGGRGGT